jgi:hypothetical protein
MGRRQGTAVFLVIAVLIVAIMGVNYLQSKSIEADNAKQAPVITTPKSPTISAAKQRANDSAIAQTLRPSDSPPSDLVLGNVNGKTVLALCYTYDVRTQQNTEPITDIVALVKSWATSHPDDCVKIICLDLPRDQLSNPADQDLPLGLSVNGKTVAGYDGNPGEGNFISDYILTTLTSIN